MTQLTFCGAAGTVTGSCTLVQHPSGSFLVDCGLFQGNRTTQELNYQPFPFDPKSASFLVLTHAHIDHSGLLPKLVNSGFRGHIYCTEATHDLLEFMLRDSAYIQESNADRINKKLERRGQPRVKPAYTVKDADATMPLVRSVEYETWFVAAADSLRERLSLAADEQVPENPEESRTGKGWIQRHFRRKDQSYSPTVDQPSLTTKMDLTLCRRRSPSFDKLCRELEKRCERRQM